MAGPNPVSRSHHRWLHSQLPAWEGEGIVSAEAAAGLRKRHPYADAGPGLVQVLFGSLGALLVGTGLIAVLGYNWDDFSRGTRLVIAFLPLLVCQVFSSWTLARGEDAAAWVRETAGLLQVLAGGAAIAIVSQIYHLGGTWQDFLFWWILISVPVLWAMRSSAVAIFHVLASAVWAAYQAGFERPWPDTPMLFPLLMLALVPWWPGLPPHWKISTAMRWIVTPAMAVGFGACAVAAARRVSDRDYFGMDSNAMIWMWLATAAIFVLVPLGRNAVAEGVGHKPQVVLGALWLIGSALCMTFSELSENFMAGMGGALPSPWGWLLVALLAGFGVMAARARRIAVLALAGIALLPALALPFTREGWEEGAAMALSWLTTLYLAGLGIVLIVLSLRGERGAPRLGATLLAVLIITRMADSEFSLLAKGVAFILVGVAFLGFNLFLGRIMKAAQSTQAVTQP